MAEKQLHGIITSGVGGLYGVRPLSHGEIGETVMCRARGVFRHENITPLPGDEVCAVPAVADDGTSDKNNNGSDTEYVIDTISERKNSLIRPALANLSHLFAVIPASRPVPDLVTADKLISSAEDKGIEPVIVISKSDTDAESAAKLCEIYKTGGFHVFTVSCESGEGTDSLTDFISEQSAGGHMTAAFAGVSGAGKSTLMTKIFPSLKLKSGEISKKIQRGKHTTRHAELYPVKTEKGVCFVADTPGFSMLDFTHYDFFTADRLPYTFREFAPLMGECRYTKCTHTKEEGCAVLENLKKGKIAPSRHESYCIILEEIRKNPEWKRRREERKPR